MRRQRVWARLDIILDLPALPKPMLDVARKEGKSKHLAIHGQGHRLQNTSKPQGRVDR